MCKLSAKWPAKSRQCKCTLMCGVLLTAPVNYDRKMCLKTDYRAPDQIIYRKFGFRCSVTLVNTRCQLGVTCDANGNKVPVSQNFFGYVTDAWPILKRIFGSNLLPHFVSYTS